MYRSTRSPRTVTHRLLMSTYFWTTASDSFASGALPSSSSLWNTITGVFARSTKPPSRSSTVKDAPLIGMLRTDRQKSISDSECVQQMKSRDRKGAEALLRLCFAKASQKGELGTIDGSTYIVDCL